MNEVHVGRKTLEESLVEQRDANQVAIVDRRHNYVLRSMTVSQHRGWRVRGLKS